MKHIKEKAIIFSLTVFMVAAVLLWNFIEGGYLFPQFYGGTPGSSSQEISLKAYEESLINGRLVQGSASNGQVDAPASLPVAKGSKLMVGGASLGIIMKTEGVLVVGYSSIESEGGQVIYPAKEGGIALGDCILSINGFAIKDDEAMLDVINQEGSKGVLTLKIKHGEMEVDKTINAYYCEETKRYRIGLYVRDNMGGVGTLTFYDPITKRFGALGHPIEGVNSAAGTEMLGRALPSAVKSIKKATKGETGEKIGYFENGEFSGVVDTVGKYGIYGIIDGEIANPLNSFLYPAKDDEVQKGAAKIITVIDGSTPELFDIKILDIDSHDDEGKGLTIAITDKALLEKTGGIIQGMSGSPIIQNNKIVGAVTYVTVNEPEKGYGCLISYMLNEYSQK